MTNVSTAPVQMRWEEKRKELADLKQLQEEAIVLASEIRPNLEKPQRGLARFRRRVASWKTAGRNYFTNRRLAKARREDLRPLYFIWTMLRNCNFLCDYCDDHMGRKYPELPLKGALSTEQGIRLLEIMRTRTPSVYFAGGEPTLRKDLPQLTRAARDLRYDPIIINTNGSAFHRQLKMDAWKTWLADIDLIVVSLDSLDLPLLKKMWVYRKPEDVIRNILMLRELAAEFRVKLMVNTVIQPGRVEHARDVLDFCRDYDIWFTPVPMNVGPTINQDLPGDREYRALTDLILDRKQDGQKITGSKTMLRRLLRSEKLVCRNTVKPHIDHDGKLVWPCKATVNVKPEHVNVLDYEDVDSLYDAASKLVNPTRFHGPARNQCGANCNWAQNYTTDSYANGLLHPMSLLGEVSEFLRS